MLAVRDELRAGILGECGAVTIRLALVERSAGRDPAPSTRTIGRILERRGVLDGRRRIRRPPPPPGWYLPDVAARRVELDAFDLIVGLRLQGGAHVEVLTGISLHGGLSGAWVDGSVTAPVIADALVEHWRGVGLPRFAQFDNDTRFLGTHGHPDVLGRIPLLCLALGVTPVFAPIREMGFQAAIESLNGRWQARVWRRFWSDDIRALQERSDRYIAATRARAAVRIDAAPVRRPMSAELPDRSPGPPVGRIVFLRRTTADGSAAILGRSYPIDPRWPHRLVRAELDLDRRSIRFHALRRRDPTEQPLLAELPYALPARRAWVTRRY